MLLTWIVALLTPVAPATISDDAVAAYVQDVRPVLQRRCVSCHGAQHQKAGLRLDTAKAVRAGGDSGPAIVAKDPAASLLMKKVAEADPKLRMPPEGEPLSETELAALRAWIAAGAPVSEEEIPSMDPRDHWAYRPPVRPPLPSGSTGAANPIDAFLDASRRAKGLTASPPIARDLWLRRVAIDLVGLPPTREELRAFRANSSDEALESAVDRLLANPAHGERWARHWMDIWRYCDGYGRGAELLFSYHHLWRWRDWIIESLNAGTGYDEMIVAMLAGDEVAPDDPGVLRATGFLARNWDIHNRNKWLDSTIEHTSRAFLGVTMQCCRCHDHKFDPIEQVEYFQMRAAFEPYQIRVDRVPGQSDRVKDGVTRVFDDYLDRPTHLFIRGDEAQPDTQRSLTPAVPAVLGGTLDIQPIPLPVVAYNPDKRSFVIDESRAAADGAVAAATEAIETARKTLEMALQAQTMAEEALRQSEQALQSATSPEDRSKAREVAIAATETAAKTRRAAIDATHSLHLAETALPVAEAARESLAAVLAVERLEDDGAKEANPALWSDAARQAVGAQRKLAVAEAVAAQLAAQHEVEQATTALDGLITAAADPKDESLKPALAKATAALVDAREKLAAANIRRTGAEADIGRPLTTDYKPRPLEFPRAKVAYRDIPSNAPYSRISTGRRLALARWITDRGNPLTARVAVNQIWARHFGEPLVPSVFDFGMRSPLPLHHELLDWLAVEFMDSGWNMKQLHRLIVTSQAYRMQSSAVASDTNRTIDPDNLYYWRMNPRRMEAEVIRDSLLHVAGRLDPVMGGPNLPLASAEEGLRRTIYYHYARDEQMPLLTMFDAPNVEECYRRHETIVPQQALALSNGKFSFDRADDISQAISAEVGDGATSEFVMSAFERLLGRLPTQAEQVAATDGLERLTALEIAETAAATDIAAQADVAGADASGAAEAAAQAALPRDRARAAFIHVLLNHNDFVTIR